MARAVAPFVVGPQICEALGLNANQITSLTLRINGHEGAIVELTGVVSDEQAHKLETVMTQYRLVPCSVMDVPGNGVEEATEDG
jgi:hypothetical protein